jgi:hypothetical protein
MEMTAKGRSYVTARGWEDLSQIIYLYEEEGLAVEESLVEQYIRNDRVVKEFTAYYELYNKYKKDYRIDEILGGRITDSVILKAQEAAFDVRLSLIGMLLDKVLTDMKDAVMQADYLVELRAPLKALKNAEDSADAGKICEMLQAQADGRRKIIASGQAAGSMSDADINKNKHIAAFLDNSKKEVGMSDKASGADAFEMIKNKYDDAVNELKADTKSVQDELHYLFEFARKAFEEGNEMLVLVTELTLNSYSARFIASFGSEDYARHNSSMMIDERKADIQAQIKELNI